MDRSHRQQRTSNTVRRSNSASSRRPRLRLTPERRIPLILDAALIEFTARGYNATRVEEIARRAGLSKGGFYAHFSGKDEVFEELLKRSLTVPALDIDALLEQSRTARDLVEQLLDILYAALSDPAGMATARLLLTEGHRLPDVREVWRKDTNALASQIGTLLRRATARGICSESIVYHEPWLILAPIAYLVSRLDILGARPNLTLRQVRLSHAELLRELLEPRAVKSTRT